MDCTACETENSPAAKENKSWMDYRKKIPRLQKEDTEDWNRFFKYCLKSKAGFTPFFFLLSFNGILFSKFWRQKKRTLEIIKESLNHFGNWFEQTLVQTASVDRANQDSVNLRLSQHFSRLIMCANTWGFLWHARILWLLGDLLFVWPKVSRQNKGSENEPTLLWASWYHITPRHQEKKGGMSLKKLWYPIEDSNYLWINHHFRNEGNTQYTSWMI